MSLNLIKNTETKSYIDNKGVTWWENPNVNVKINSIGEVYRRTKIGSNTYVKAQPTSIGRFSVSIGGKTPQPTPYSSLYSRMVMGVQLGTRTLLLKNPKKGYIDGNIEIVSGREFRKEVMNGSTVKSLSNVMKNTSNKTDSPAEYFITNFYTHYPKVEKYITEDFAEFPTLELAEWHQEKVTKGKGNAQVVLDYNGGYVLAEQIYFQEVVYNKQKPYSNIKDVLENNGGIKEVKQQERVVFDKLEGLAFTNSLDDIGLSKLFNFETTIEHAKELQVKLEKYADAYAHWNTTCSDLKEAV